MIYLMVASYTDGTKTYREVDVVNNNSIDVKKILKGFASTLINRKDRENDTNVISHIRMYEVNKPFFEIANKESDSGDSSSTRNAIDPYYKKIDNSVLKAVTWKNNVLTVIGDTYSTVLKDVPELDYTSFVASIDCGKDPVDYFAYLCAEYPTEIRQS